MDVVKIFHHRDYAMHCGARALDNGRFAPKLSILRQVWPSRPKEIAIPRGDYVSQDEAIDAAHQIGVHWMSDFGQL